MQLKSVCVCVCAYACVHTFVCIRACVYVRAYVHLHACKCVCVYVYSLCVSARAYVCVVCMWCVRVVCLWCVCARVCMCVCGVYVCGVCVRVQRMHSRQNESTCSATSNLGSFAAMDLNNTDKQILLFWFVLSCAFKTAALDSEFDAKSLRRHPFQIKKTPFPHLRQISCF